MNRIFKSVWSSARGCCVAVGENAKSRGKGSRSKLTIAAAAAAMIAGGMALNASANAYVESASLATSKDDFTTAAKSWETEEYKKDWGLGAMNSSSAYALGFNGQAVAVGVMDSGALLEKHPDLAGSRFHASEASSVYGSTGDRYPQSWSSPGRYEAGKSVTESGVIDGNWIAGTNDDHGTHVTGSVGANRDGSEFHGVAWGADVWVGNTGGTDDTNYGPFQDYTFFYNGWKALADNLITANGADRGGVINNSFGTNLRVSSNGSSGHDGGNTKVHYPTNTVSQTEYEYFLFNQVYGDGPSFVDGAYEAVKDTNVIQVFTTGNRDFANPYYRPLYPYFNPSAEKNWVAVAGLMKTANAEKPTYALNKQWNEAGLAKWWTVTAPGSSIYGSKVDLSNGAPKWENASGTSMAAPHVTGALTVLMSRYADMSAVQVRDVMFTTANHYNPDGNVMDGWANTDKTISTDGQVSDRMGWGVPDLNKGMYGPGQFLGEFNYNMAATPLDVWSNSITNVALDQRKEEDAKWKAAAEKWLKNPTLELKSIADLSESEKKLLGDVLLNTEDDIVGLNEKQEQISKEDAIAWRTKYYKERIAAIELRAYEGSLVKRGAGTLVMTGNNTYRGGTVVEAGALYGFNHSFGVTAGDDESTNGKVVVNGGTFGIINAYDDKFTMKGELKTLADAGHSVDITVNKGGTYALAAGQDVNVGTLTFKEGSSLTITALDKDVMAAVMGGETITGSVTAEKLEGVENAPPTPDYAFLTTEVAVKDNKLTATMSRNQSAASDFARNAPQAAVASTIVGAAESAITGELALSSKDQFRNTVASLGSDLHLKMQQATLMNSASMTRTIKEIAADAGTAKTAELGNGVRLWATGTGAWMSLDGGSANADVDAYAGYIGAEYHYGLDSKAGIFFGYGTTKLDAARAGKVDSDDLHFGIYGQNNWDLVGLGYGFIYTSQDRSGDRTLTVGADSQRNHVSYDADVTQLFVEAGYRGFITESFSVEPYAGLGYMHVSADGFTERVGNHAFKTELDDQDVWTFNLGVRGKKNFMLGNARMAVKGDLAWLQFMGDNQGTARMSVGDAGTAQLKGDELKGMGVVSLGVETQIGKNATIGVSYTGAFGSDVTSNGVGATMKLLF